MTHRRVAIEIHGAVQGVGFRPFVYRLATERDLTGWVRNDVNGVFIEFEGPSADIEDAVARLKSELPPAAMIDQLEVLELSPIASEAFEIRPSEPGGEKSALILPDLVTCAECAADVADPSNRRYGYPFTNCTNCGPRFSIIRDLPYDRPNTTMRDFVMCGDCAGEYADPTDRRFHAQPNACAVCGPSIAYDARGAHAVGEDAIDAVVADLHEGHIVALKALGGYQLLVDATNDAAVERLRIRKARPEKPFAVLTADAHATQRVVEADEVAIDALESAGGPIVLLPERTDSGLAPSISPPTSTVGVMLPTTPLHRLIAERFGKPVVATSGNLTDEPIATDDADAIERLGAIADSFLTHDRPIQRHVDDSVAWIVEGEPRIVRRARGYAPMPIASTRRLPTVLGTGAHLKNTIALSVDRSIFVSQHIGDLETVRAEAAFRDVIDDLTRMYEAEPIAIAHDAHPDYVSTRYAHEADRFPGARRIAVQHHHAHLASCLADNDTEEAALGVTWDGTGLGLDGTIWGGEFLLGNAAGFERVAHLRTFGLPGGEVAVREPRRSAAGLLHEAGIELETSRPGFGSFEGDELRIVGRMIDQGINTPRTSSAGRLFDAVSALLGLVTKSSFEGHAAMALESISDPDEAGAYDIELVNGEAGLVLDWSPMLTQLLEDLAIGTAEPIAAARFHNALTNAIVAVAQAVAHPTVALTGGCFQNRRLTEHTAERLRDAGFEVLLHRRVPPNDGGISLGQVVIAAATLRDLEQGDRTA